MVRDNSWALRKIEQLPADFYGTVELQVRAGAVRQISETKTTPAPDILREKDAAALHRANEGVRPLRSHDVGI
jgi:hypothetical protein